MPDLQQYPWNLNLTKNVEEKCFFFCEFLHFKKCASHWHKETANLKIKDRKKWITNSYLIRQRFSGRISLWIIAERVSWNYAYSHVNERTSCFCSYFYFYCSFLKMIDLQICRSADLQIQSHFINFCFQEFNSRVYKPFGIIPRMAAS